MSDDFKGRVIIGVIGDDIHIVGNRIMHLALEESGFQVFNLRTRVRPEEFCQAALEVNADAVFVSSLNGEGEYWCADFRRPVQNKFCNPSFRWLRRPILR